tara:strand:- start:26 stop:622 length:597 start_codon:yes stop_codon:yes gene_type:complete
MSTYFGLNPEKFGHADIFIIDCEREIKPSKIRFYLNKFRTSGTSKYGHLMYIEIEQRPSSKNPNPRHAFNIWIENLEKRTTAGQQSQSAGLHKIIKLEYNGRTTVDQRTRKADELVKNMSKNYDEIINKWEDLGIISLIDFINYNDFSCVNSEIISYLNERIKTYDFEKHKNLFKKVWRIDQENEDSLEEWYNREFIN